MQRETLIEVWKIRFQKMLNLEEEAVDLYQTLIEENSQLLDEADVEEYLKEILKDEIKHVKMAKKLCQLAEELKS